MTLQSNLWYPPAAPSLFDDEFDGSKVLETFWDLSFVVDPAAPEALADFASGNVRVGQNFPRDSWTTFQPPYDGVFRTISQSPSPGVVVPDGFYWARVKTHFQYASISADEIAMSLFISSTDSGDYDDNNHVEVYHSEADTGSIAVQFLSTTDGIIGGNTTMSDLENFGQQWEYIGILKDGNTYHHYVASSGGFWCLVGTPVWAGAAILDRFGILFGSATLNQPGNTQYGIDFFRYSPNKRLP